MAMVMVQISSVKKWSKKASAMNDSMMMMCGTRMDKASGIFFWLLTTIKFIYAVV